MMFSFPEIARANAKAQAQNLGLPMPQENPNALTIQELAAEIDNPEAAPLTPRDLANNPMGTTDMLKLLREYLTDEIPREKEGQADRKREMAAFFGILSKSSMLTFLDAQDVEISTLQFEIARINYLESKPAWELTTQDIMMLDQLDMLFRFKVKRSVGSGKTVMNERLAEVAQVVQSINLSGQQQQQHGGVKGFLGRILG